jgi:hypothetical protein
MYTFLHVKYRYSWQILIKLEISQQIFEKYSTIKFHEILPMGGGGAEVFSADRLTDKRDEANRSFSHN